MASTRTTGATVGQVTLIIFNIFFSVLSAIVLLVGIYLMVQGRDYGFVYAENELTSVANLLVASGIVTFCIAAVGFIGACCKSRPLLVIFSVTLSLIILLEVAAATVGVAYISQKYTTFKERYTDAWQTAISEYRINPDDQMYMEDVNNAVDGLQQELECCGGTAPDDWGVFNPVALNGLNQTLPSSCNCTPGDRSKNCGTVTFVYNITSNGSTVFYNISQTAWTVGCVNGTIDKTRVLFGFFIGASFSILIIEMFGIIISLCFFCCISSFINQCLSRIPTIEISEETRVLKTSSSTNSF